MVVVLHCRRLVTVHVVVSVVDVAGMASFADAGTSRLMTSGKVMLATMVDDDFKLLSVWVSRCKLYVLYFYTLVCGCLYIVRVCVYTPRIVTLDLNVRDRKRKTTTTTTTKTTTTTTAVTYCYRS